MKKFIVIILLGMGILSLGFSSHAQEFEPYLNIYWVLGDVDSAVANGHNIYLENATAKDTIASQRFAINAGMLSTLEVGRSYDVFTTFYDGPNPYHIGPTPVPISGKGYEEVSTTLLAGIGEIPQVADLGIRRVADTAGSNVEVMWRAGGTSVNIYRLVTSDASSVYTVDPVAWTLLGAQTTDNYVPPDDLVGRDFKQSYYKILLTEFSFPAAMLQVNMSTSETVGKYNVAINGDPGRISFTIISAPFVQRYRDWPQVIGNQLVYNDVPGDADQLLKWTGLGWGGTMYLSSAGWVESSSGSGFNQTLGEGTVVRVPALSGRATKDISVVGKVLGQEYVASAAENFGSNIGLNLWTLISPPYPKIHDWGSTGLNVAAGSHASDVPGDADQMLSWTGSGWGGQMYLSSTGWAEIQTSPSSYFIFQPGLGFAYRRSGTPGAGVDWRLRL